MFKFKKCFTDSLHSCIIDMVENYSEEEVIIGSVSGVQPSFGGYRLYCDTPKKKNVLLFVSDESVFKYLCIKAQEQNEYIRSLNKEFEDFSSETNRQLYDIQREK